MKSQNGSNISKLRYFLHNIRRSAPNQRQTPSKQPKSNSKSKLQSCANRSNYLSNRYNTGLTDATDSLNMRQHTSTLQIIDEKSNDRIVDSSIDVDVLAIKEMPTKDEPQSIASIFPQGPDKQGFIRFLEELKDDLMYQNAITLFTIQFFRRRKPPRSFRT